MERGPGSFDRGAGCLPVKRSPRVVVDFIEAAGDGRIETSSACPIFKELNDFSSASVPAESKLRDDLHSPLGSFCTRAHFRRLEVSSGSSFTVNASSVAEGYGLTISGRKERPSTVCLEASSMRAVAILQNFNCCSAGADNFARG